MKLPEEDCVLKRNDIFSPHPKKETPLGFLCDLQIFDLVMALNSFGQEYGVWTVGSCQDVFGSCEIPDWKVPRCYVTLKGNSPQALLRFALEIKKILYEESGWNQFLCIDVYKVPIGEYLTLTLTQRVQQILLPALLSFCTK